MGALSPTHWLIIVGVLVLLFGAKRLPDAARSLGRSARILKAEVKEMNPDGGIEPAAPTALPASPTGVAASAATADPGPAAAPLVEAPDVHGTSTGNGRHPER